MIGRGFQNEMRAHFDPLMADLYEAVEKDILVAGGYGLYLKQSWLSQNPQTSTVVSLDQWQDTVPRVTKDLDLVLNLNLIAKADTQQKILRVLTQHQFVVSETNPRWQFIKAQSAERHLVVELHSPEPAQGTPGLVTDKVRVKHKPSLGDKGVHGRKNPEAVGCELHPFHFTLDGFTFHVPNPLTWSIMKLTAAQERWEKSPARSFEHEQAIKHAGDACRVIAMVTREENDLVPEISETIRSSEQFQKVAQIVYGSFSHDDGWMSQVLANRWSAEQLTLIREILGRWFFL